MLCEIQVPWEFPNGFMLSSHPKHDVFFRGKKHAKAPPKWKLNLWVCHHFDYALYRPTSPPSHTSSRLRSRICLHWLQKWSCHWGSFEAFFRIENDGSHHSKEEFCYEFASKSDWAMKELSHLIPLYIKHHWLHFPNMSHHC